MLGGSSSMNSAYWTRGAAAQFDAFSELLEPEEARIGWNWNNLFSYMKRVMSCVLACRWSSLTMFTGRGSTLR